MCNCSQVTEQKTDAALLLSSPKAHFVSCRYVMNGFRRELKPFRWVPYFQGYAWTSMLKKKRKSHTLESMHPKHLAGPLRGNLPPYFPRQTACKTERSWKPVHVHGSEVGQIVRLVYDREGQEEGCSIETTAGPAILHHKTPFVWGSLTSASASELERIPHTQKVLLSPPTL